MDLGLEMCCTIVTTKTQATVLFALVLIMFIIITNPYIYIYIRISTIKMYNIATTVYSSLPKNNICLLRDLSSPKNPRLCHTFCLLRGLFPYLEDPNSENPGFAGGISVDLLNPGCFVDPKNREKFCHSNPK